MVEYLAFPRMQRLDHLLAARAQRLGRAIKIQAVPRLVLHLGKQDRLAAQRRSPRDPIALGKHADNLAVRVLADLSCQRPAVSLGHPVLRLDEFVRCHPRFERFEQLRVFEILDLCGLLKLGRVHESGCSTEARCFKSMQPGALLGAAGLLPRSYQPGPPGGPM